jgi:hypothetical protein
MPIPFFLNVDIYILFRLLQTAVQERALHEEGVAAGNNSLDLPERENRNAPRVTIPNGRYIELLLSPSGYFFSNICPLLFLNFNVEVALIVCLVFQKLLIS